MNQNKNTNNICRICESSQVFIIFSDVKDIRMGKPGNFYFSKCLECGLIWLNSSPPDLETYYDSNKFSMHTQVKMVKRNFIVSVARKLIMRILPQSSSIGIGIKYSSKGSYVLDIGCGSGHFLLRMASEDRICYGIDISTTACENARAVGLDNIYCGTLAEIEFPDKYFDLINLTQVFEHIQDIKGTLEIIHRILKKNGILSIDVPNGKSLNAYIFHKYYSGLDAPRHWYLFDKSSLLKIIDNNDFKLLTSFTRSFHFVECFESWRNSYHREDKDKLFFLDLNRPKRWHRIFRSTIARFFELVLGPLGLGDTLGLIIKKK